MPETNDPDAVYLKAKSDALRLAAVRPRSVAEMRERLQDKRYDGAVVERVVDLLVRQGVLDDERYARARAATGTGSKAVGKRALRKDLIEKGLSPELVERTMQRTADYDEKEAACNLVRPRLRAMRGLPREKKKARIYGFLTRRGFSSGTIFEAMDKLLKEDQGEA